MANDIGSCNTCKHFIWKKVNNTNMPSGNCDAFPGGIPIEIQFGSVVHDKPFTGDNGIRYEKRILKEIKPPLIRQD
mgnify:CR=1 FL=1